MNVNEQTDQRATETPGEHASMTDNASTSTIENAAERIDEGAPGGAAAAAVGGVTDPAVAQAGASAADDGDANHSMPDAAAKDAPAETATAGANDAASDAASDAPSDAPSDAAALAEAPTRLLARGRAAAAPAPVDAPEPPPAPLTLPVGATLGAYRIDAIAHEEPGAAVYLASLTEDAAANDAETPANELGSPRFTITEQADQPSSVVSALVALALRHPRLLAPMAIESETGRWYLVSQDLDAAPETTRLLVADGGRLTPIEGLRAGAGLADALSYLHRNGVAHLHVSPETILTRDSRAYLVGVEMATLVDWTSRDTSLLFARDANFLARTLGALVGQGTTAEASEPAEPSDAEAERAVREIVARGEAGAYNEPDEVGAACAMALRSFGVALDSIAGAGDTAESPPTRLIFTTGSATTVGRVRTQNQDALAITQFDLRDDATRDAPLAIFLVSDGMGGEAHGEVASRITARAVTVEMARHFTLPNLLWPILTLGADGVNASDPAGAANAAGSGGASLAQALEQAVAEANRQTRVFARMLGAATGATLTVIAASGAHAALAHLGDSRAYLLRDMRLIQLTEDHSLLARLIAMDHPLLSDPSFVAPRSVLYRSVGQEDEAPPDMLEFTFNPGDRVLLCSDGLWDELDDQTIGQELAQATDPQSCAERLVDLANASGGHDNSTAVVVFVGAQRADDLGVQGESADAFVPFAADEHADAAIDALDDSLGLYQPYNPDGLDDITDAPPSDPAGLAVSPHSPVEG